MSPFRKGFREVFTCNTTSGLLAGMNLILGADAAGNGEWGWALFGFTMAAVLLAISYREELA